MMFRSFRRHESRTARASAPPRHLIFALSGALFVAALLGACAGASEVEQAFADLTRVRDAKRAELEEYFEHVETTVESVQTDGTLRSAFLDLNDLFHGRPVSAPDRRGRSLGSIEHSILDRYLDAYQLFYDIHFVSASGDVFYSILKQDDLFENIFEGELSDSLLARRLRESPEAATADFGFPGFGSEPSAFFAQPIRSESGHAGWIVFQFLSSRLAEIFAHEDSLGRTGEVFLVNRDHFMLTDSYHLPESSVLRRHLSSQNIESKFRERAGEKVVVDYRGYEALTSFEVCEIMGFEWLLIAKIDFDEVVTREYAADPRRHHDRITEYLRTSPIPQSTVTPPEAAYQPVHLDDFARIESGPGLFTPGVATCTSIVVSMPGRFAYMAHVSPYDRIYGGSRTDLVRSLLRRVSDFEVADKEMREVNVVIVTPMIRHSERLVDELVDAGIFLSQITIMKNPEARCADVRYEFATGETYVTWCYGDAYEEERVQLASQTETLADVMRRLGDVRLPEGLQAPERTARVE